MLSGVLLSRHSTCHVLPYRGILHYLCTSMSSYFVCRLQCRYSIVFEAAARKYLHVSVSSSLHALLLCRYEDKS